MPCDRASVRKDKFPTYSAIGSQVGGAGAAARLHRQRPRRGVSVARAASRLRWPGGAIASTGTRTQHVDRRRRAGRAERGARSRGEHRRRRRTRRRTSCASRPRRVPASGSPRPTARPTTACRPPRRRREELLLDARAQAEATASEAESGRDGAARRGRARARGGGAHAEQAREAGARAARAGARAGRAAARRRPQRVRAGVGDRAPGVRARAQRPPARSPSRLRADRAAESTSTSARC